MSDSQKPQRLDADSVVIHMDPSKPGFVEPMEI